MSIDEIIVGDSYKVGWILTDDTGAAVDADSTPTVARIFKNGASTAETATVTDQTGTETGCYSLSYTPAAGMVGEHYEVVVEAVIGGVTKPNKFQFVVRSATVSVSSIGINAITSSSIATNAFNNSAFTTGFYNAINAEVDTALADYDGPTSAEMLAAFGTVEVASMATAALAQFATVDTGETTAVDGAVAKISQGSSSGGDATLANQTAILAQLQAGVVSFSPVNEAQDNLTIVEGRTYTNEIEFTMDVDYTTGHTAKLILSGKKDKSIVYKRAAATIASATSITVPLDGEFDIDPTYDGSPPTAHVQFSLQVEETISGDIVQSYYGACQIVGAPAYA